MFKYKIYIKLSRILLCKISFKKPIGKRLKIHVQIQNSHCSDLFI